MVEMVGIMADVGGGGGKGFWRGQRGFLGVRAGILRPKERAKI